MYYWIICATASGDLGTGSGTHQPDSTFAPSGFALLGPYDDGSNPMPSDFKSAYQNPDQYLYQNGAFVTNPNYSSIQLAQAKQSRLAYLVGMFSQAIASGFPSSADGTIRTYAIDPVSMGKWTGTLSLINSGGLTSNITVKDIAGDKVTLSPTQFKQFALDGFNYFNAQEQNLWAKEDDVSAATTVDGVNAVTY